MAATSSSAVNNEFYDSYGDRWYTAFDDPVALLRAESKTKIPWILKRIKVTGSKSVLDIGCGAGFLTNALALEGFEVTGVDLSKNSLQVAGVHDVTGKVRYLAADAYALPFPDQSFDVITCMDFLEHVDKPEAVIQEIARVLRPEGLFFYHTFNRNFFSYLVIIKYVEWFIRNTPKKMHVLSLFIKPKELKNFCQKCGLKNIETVGLRPVLTSMPLKNYLTGVVDPHFRFTTTASTMLSYIGYAKKVETKVH